MGNPEITKKFKPREYISHRKGNVYVVKWKDKRDVLVITTEQQKITLL